jgi:hypothetical protein
MNGYIVLDVTCKKALTRYHFWFEHESYKDAYAFSEKEIGEIKLSCENLDMKPAYKQRAEYRDGDVKILGSLERFW